MGVSPPSWRKLWVRVGPDFVSMVIDHSICVHDSSRVVSVLRPTVIRASFACSGWASSPHPAVQTMTIKMAAMQMYRSCIDDLTTRSARGGIGVRDWNGAAMAGRECAAGLLSSYASPHVRVNGGGDVMDEPRVPLLVRLQVCSQCMTVGALLRGGRRVLGLLHVAAPPRRKGSATPMWH